MSFSNFFLRHRNVSKLAPPSSPQVPPRKVSEMRFHEIVYLDAGMVGLAYEEIFGQSPPTSISKSQDLGAKVEAGVAGANASISETKSYSFSPTQMYFKLEKELLTLPTIGQARATEQQGLFWVKGMMCVGSQNLHLARSQDEEGRVLRLPVVMLQETSEGKGGSLSIATNPSYFTSGYDQLASNLQVWGANIDVPVRALLRSLSVNKRNGFHAFAPFVITRTEG